MSSERKSYWQKQLYKPEHYLMFEKEREPYNFPLGNLHRIVARQQIGSSKVLFLGAGTGQDMQLSGLDQQQMSGLDISSASLATAAQRLPDSTFYTGDILDILDGEEIPPFPVIAAWNTLDCLPPESLSKVLSTIRRKNSKLVVGQDFTASFEYYGIPTGQGTGLATPGYTSWTEEQSSVVSEIFDGKKCETHDQIFEIAQEMLEQSLQGTITPQLLNAIKQSRMKYTQFPLDRVKHFPNYAKVITFIDALEHNLMREIRIPRFQNESVHHAYNMAALAKRCLHNISSHAIMQLELERAGFKSISTATLVASETEELDLSVVRDLLSVWAQVQNHSSDKHTYLRVNGTPIVIPTKTEQSIATVNVIVAQ